MNSLDVIDLEVGAGSWLQAAPWALATMGFAALLMSAAEPAGKAIMLGSLCLACIVCFRGWLGKSSITHLRLRADGSAVLYTATGALSAALADGGWCSRCCCVVPFVETLSGRRFRCLLCHSRNSADGYRRLLVHLRLAGAGDGARGVPM
jgi:hypothetical protein